MGEIGQSQLRIEDTRLLTGQGVFTADAGDSGAAVMRILRSPVAAGEITSLDTAEATAMPGVIAVLSGRDMMADGLGAIVPRLLHPGPDGGEMRVPEVYPLSHGSLRYAGQPVALVVAETAAQAEDAAEAIVLEYSEHASVTDPLAAAAADAPRVWPQFDSNVSFRAEKGDAAAVRATLDGSAHVLRQRLKISRVTAAALEPRGAVARFDTATGRYHLETGTQTAHRVAIDLAAVLGVETAQIHVLGRDCGGSFGMKNSGYPEQALALWAAKRTGRTVRWQANRLESFEGDAHARDQWADAELGLDENGVFTALDVEIHAGLGACLGPASTHSSVANLGGLSGPYRTPHIHAVVNGMFTNAQAVAPYRGAGRPEATYIIERMIDLAATELGLDRAELRRRNLIAADQMPYATGFQFTYDSGDFPAVLEQALEAADWTGFPARRAEALSRGRLRGIGIANPVEIAGGPAAKPNPEFASVTLSPQGDVQLRVGSFDSGQGHTTGFRQVLADRLGLSMDRVTVIAGDTDLVERGIGTFGSRTMGAAGTALWHGMDAIIDRLRDEAAEALEVSSVDLEFAQGRYGIRGTDRGIAFAEVLARMPEPVSASNFSSADGATFPNGCHICEVETDPETGLSEVKSYVVVDDVGTVINPMLVKGQITGGVAQGLGQALMESIEYDPDTGQLLSASFMDYAMPRATSLPGVGVLSHPVPTASNPLGVKGAGEAGTVGALAAVISAVCDALGPRGVRHLDMPATPLAVWQALQKA